MPLFSFRCLTKACLDKSGNHNGTVYESDVQGTSDELRKLPNDACPNCGNKGPGRIHRLDTIHFVREVRAGERTDFSGLHDGWVYLCDRARKSPLQKRTTTEVGAVTCPECKKILAETVATEEIAD